MIIHDKKTSGDIDHYDDFKKFIDAININPNDIDIVDIFHN